MSRASRSRSTPGRRLDVDLDDARLAGTLEEPLHLRARQPELARDLLLRPIVDVRPVGDAGEQLTLHVVELVGHEPAPRAR